MATREASFQGTGRSLPGKGGQALSLPADVVPRPEGLGLLLFAEAEGKK